METLRKGFGEGLVTAAQDNEKIVGLTADLKESTFMHLFADKFPDRFFDCGVAEQAMVTVASGMANYGKIPFVSSYSVFSPGRNWEQIRTTICVNNFPVKIISTHAGLNVGPDGATHQALEDIALMRVLPNMQVIVPADYEEARKATVAIAKTNSPTYLRLSREKSAMFTTQENNFEIGKATTLWESRDPQATIIGCGPVLYEALMAAKELEDIGIEIQVINMHTIKPIDEDAILNAARISGAIVTVEDHQIAGGLGSAVAEVVTRRHSVPMEFIGANDSFGESGTAEELFGKYGLKSKNIIEAVKRVIARKTY